MRTEVLPVQFGSFARRVFCPDDPKRLMLSWGRWGGIGDFAARHLFVDDYRIEVCWRRPEQALVRCLSVGVVTAPDFSVPWKCADAFSQYQCWRSASVASWWQCQGVFVVPVLQWSSSFCGSRFIEPGSVVAVRGPRLGEDSSQWQFGFYRAITAISPARILIFGGGSVSFGPDDFAERSFYVFSKGGVPRKERV